MCPCPRLPSPRTNDLALLKPSPPLPRCSRIAFAAEHRTGHRCATADLAKVYTLARTTLSPCWPCPCARFRHGETPVNSARTPRPKSSLWPGHNVAEPLGIANVTTLARTSRERRAPCCRARFRHEGGALDGPCFGPAPVLNSVTARPRFNQLKVRRSRHGRNRRL